MKKEHEGKKQVGMKMKLVATILPCVAVVLLIIIVASYNLSKVIVSNSANNRLLAESESISNDISGWLNTKVKMLETIRGTLDGMDLDERELGDYLIFTTTIDEDVPYGVYMGDAEKHYMDPTWTPPADFVPAERDWYQEGMGHEQVALGVPYRDAQTGELIVSATAKLKKGLGKDTVMSGDIFLNTISETISQYRVLNSGYCFLVYNSGESSVILAHPNAELLDARLDELDASTMEGQALTYIQEDKFNKTVTVNGEAYLFAVNQIENCDWVLFSCAPQKSALKDIKTLQLVFLIISLIGLAVIAVIIERMIHMVVRPIRGLTQNIKKMTEGDFGIEVKAKGNDEIGIMSRELKSFIKSMRVMIEDINNVSGTMNDQAQSSLQISETLYSSAENQATAMKELNTTVEQMANSVSEVANNASSLAVIVSQTGEKGKTASGKMEETVSLSREGRENMERIEVAMKEIENSVISLQKVVTMVGSSTEEISKFVGIIGDIASQTNLLSLNAAIEAARAGEAGKGFAVVAEEIGHLAETSSDAVAKISSLTDEINEQVADTVRQTAESLSCIQENSQQVSKACDTFELIFNTIHETGELVEEMVKEVGEVDGVATSVAAITEQQSASTQEILATTENLTELAGNVTDNSQVVAGDAEKLAETVDVLAEHMKGFSL